MVFGTKSRFAIEAKLVMFPESETAWAKMAIYVAGVRFGDKTLDSVWSLEDDLNRPISGGHERSIGFGLLTGGSSDAQGHEEAGVHA